ncbi:hypothetical protein DVH05_005098 [Phytophthora capsici]|nr:hypothetical protein DVH05_005098 [Phytophthora capsici]
MSGFRARWAELKKEGWTSKRPTGLSVDFTYIKPGKTKADTRGKDVFGKGEELMRYLDRLDIASAAKAKQVSEQPIGDQRAEQDRSERTTVSANVTATASPLPAAQWCSDDQRQHQIDQDTASDAESLASSANSRPVPVTLLCTSPHVTPSPLHESPHVPTSMNEGDLLNGGTRGAFNAVDNAPAAPKPRRCQYSEYPDEYQVISSDAENDDEVGSDENSEFDESEGGGSDELDEEDNEDPLFNESLIDAVGGFANIASGAIAADILKGMSTSRWSKPVTYNPYPYLNQPYVPRSIESLREVYPGVCGDDYGPTPRALEAASSASGALFYFYSLGCGRVLLRPATSTSWRILTKESKPVRKASEKGEEVIWVSEELAC